MAITAGAYKTSGHSPAQSTAAVSAPAGIQVGDILICSIAIPSASVSGTGWTEITTITNTNFRTTIFYRAITSSGDIASSYDFAITSGGRVWRAVMQIFRGGETSDVIDASAVTATGGNGSATVTGVTTTVDGAMLVGVLGGSNNDDTSSPTGMTKQVEFSDGGFLISHYTQVIATAGATGSRTFTVAEAGGDIAAALFAITPDQVGTITLSDDPTGTIQETTPDFDGTWSHSGSADMTKVQVRLLNTSDIVVQTGDEYDITDVDSGDDFTVSWANTGFTTLSWGTDYRYQMRGYDGTNWSDWSTSRSFSTNSAPTVPSGLSPNTTAVAQTSLPKLSFAMSDSDDTVATGLKGYVEIFGADDSLNATKEATYNSSSGKWEYQTTASEVDAFETFTWDAYGYDGTLYSGEATSAASATRSATATFTYAQGPTVTVSSPAADEVLTSNSLTVTWSIDTGTQQSYEIYIFDADGTKVVDYDGGMSTDTSKTFTDIAAIVNGGEYTVVVHVETTLAAVGESSAVAFSVDYTAPDQLETFTATATKVGNDLWASAIAFAWSQTDDDAFSHYTITATASGGPDDGTITLAIIDDAETTSWTWYLPASGTNYTFGITQTTVEGSDFVTSDTLEANGSVTLGGVVLVSVSDPDDTRTTLKHTSVRRYPRDIDETAYQPASGADPVTVRSDKHTMRPRFDAQIVDDSEATAAERRAELEALDDAGGTVCYRDNHGRKLFVTLPVVEITDQVPDWYTARIELRGERYTQGVS